MPDSRVDTIIARVRPWSARSIAALVASHDLPDDEPFIAASDFRAAVREAAQPDYDHAELLLKAWLADGRDAVIERGPRDAAGDLIKPVSGSSEPRKETT